MCDNHRRRARFFQKRTHLLLHGITQLHVEPRERLVHQHNSRAWYERSGKRYTLLLATRENIGKFVGIGLKPNAREHGHTLATGGGGRKIAQSEGNVVDNG